MLRGENATQSAALGTGPPYWFDPRVFASTMISPFPLIGSIPVGQRSETSMDCDISTPERSQWGRRVVLQARVWGGVGVKK
jgi:hypothetical protein